MLITVTWFKFQFSSNGPWLLFVTRVRMKRISASGKAPLYFSPQASLLLSPYRKENACLTNFLTSSSFLLPWLTWRCWSAVFSAMPGVHMLPFQTNILPGLPFFQLDNLFPSLSLSFSPGRSALDHSSLCSPVPSMSLKSSPFIFFPPFQRATGAAGSLLSSLCFSFLP